VTDWVDEAVSALPPLATVAEAVTLLRTTRRNFYRLVAARRIRTVRPVESGSSKHLIPRSELARYLRSLEA
jgi:excisionase family DNA binding protein